MGEKEEPKKKKKKKRDLASVLTIIVTGRTAELKPLRRTEYINTHRKQHQAALGRKNLQRERNMRELMH